MKRGTAVYWYCLGMFWLEVLLLAGLTVFDLGKIAILTCLGVPALALVIAVLKWGN